MLLRWKGLKLARYNLVVSDSVKTMFESGNLNPWLVDGGIEFPDGIRTINLQNPTIMKAISGMEYDLKAIKSVCEKEDCDVVILSVPVAVDPKIVSYNEMGYVVIDEENMRREADTIDSLYGSFAEHIGAKFLGFTDLFRQKSKSMALFYKYDGHFTPAGHRLLGDSLASFLTKNYFNQTSRPR
jgi:hypothetical protein